MLCYCPKCGRIVQEVYGRETQICDYCSTILAYIPEKFLIGQSKCIMNDELKEQFVNEYIKSSPQFDQYLFDHRDEELHKRRIQNQVKMVHAKVILEEQNRVAKCPSCGSSNVSKISAASRLISVNIFGLASSKLGKTYKCNNCGTTW